ncbi:MAG: hypothetical protein GXO74_14625 [Calditrichaeota bacterium]|nr:hypothetical protein [Calditrichota bacterium]
MMKKVSLLLLISVVTLGMSQISFAQKKVGMSKWEYYDKLCKERGWDNKLAKPSGFNDRKYGRFDVGKIGLEINNANRLGYSREMLTFEYPIGAGITYQWCEALIVGGILNGEKRISNGTRGCYEDVNENHYEPLPGYDSGVGENGLAMSNKPESWPASWPADAGPVGSKGFPGVYEDGEIAADAEGVWMAVDDDPTCQQLTPLHLKTFGRGMQWSSVLAEDMIVFKYYITNTGTDTIKDCYVGIHTDMDCPEEGSSEWMDDYGVFIPVEEDSILGNFLYIWDGDDKSAGYIEKGVAWQGLKMLETPKGPDGKELGLTTLFIATYDDFFVPTQADVYNMLSSGISPIDNVTPAPGDWTQTPNTYGPDITSLHASGPFDLAPGQTVTFTFANVFGLNKADLLANAALCQTIYDLNYKTASPPAMPNVRAVAGDRMVTLYWDADPSESDVDDFTGHNAFEGYKIYRSTDRGLTWGDPINNSIGALVGYLPTAQYDLQDGVKGNSAIDPYFYLGNDTGLRHKFVDKNLKNGVEYWYAVCAYDHDDVWEILPVPPMENARLSKAIYEGDNTVSVIPQGKPAGYTGPDLSFTRQGNTTVELLWEVMDEDAVQDNVYTITFDDTTNSAQKMFSVYDENKGDYVLKDVAKVHGEEDTPTFDGIKLKIVDEDAVAFDDQRSGWVTESGDSSNCNWKIYATSGSPLPYNYEVRFTATGDTAFFPPTMVLPFEIWNVTLGTQADIGNFKAADTDTTPEMKSTWTSGDVLQLRETIDGKVKMTWQIILSAPSDTTVTEVPPQQGDIAKVFTLKPLTSQDLFTLTTKAATTAGADEKSLDQIRVVPNPYAVTSSYENAQTPWVREIQFHNLPERCEIRIFTVSGDLVQILHHEPGSDGYRGPAVEAWNLWTYNDQEVAFGIFFYYVKADGVGEKMGKFAIIK